MICSDIHVDEISLPLLFVSCLLSSLLYFIFLSSLHTNTLRIVFFIYVIKLAKCSAMKFAPSKSQPNYHSAWAPRRRGSIKRGKRLPWKIMNNRQCYSWNNRYCLKTLLPFFKQPVLDISFFIFRYNMFWYHQVLASCVK